MTRLQALTEHTLEDGRKVKAGEVYNVPDDEGVKLIRERKAKPRVERRGPDEVK